MDWSNIFGSEKQPTVEEIAKYIANPLWDELNAFLQESYEVEPTYSFSQCSGQPGWNIKYQKSGRSLCTLYPMSGFFIALVVIGAKEDTEVELLAPMFTGHVQGLLKSSVSLAGGRWLMINVTDEAILKDVKQLIQLRRKIKKG